MFNKVIARQMLDNLHNNKMFITEVDRSSNKQVASFVVILGNQLAKLV